MSDFPPPPDYSGSPQLPPPVTGEWSGYPQSGFYQPGQTGGPPPGYVAYGGQGAYGASTQKIGSLTKALLILLTVTAALSVVRALALLLLHSKAVDVTNGSLTVSSFSDSTSLYTVIGLLAGLVGIAAIVVQIIWTFRMAKNLQAKGRQLRFGPGASIAINLLGGCTLYILNFLMWRDLWQASDPTIAPNDGRWRQSSVGSIVTLWFAAQIVTLVGGIAAGVGAVFVGFSRSNTAQDLATRLNDRFGFIAVVSLVTVAASVVFIFLVQQLAARHERAIGEVTS